MSHLRYFGGAGFKGYSATDYVYLDANKTCGASNFEWFLAVD